jgi:hypothetical protein
MSTQQYPLPPSRAQEKASIGVPPAFCSKSKTRRNSIGDKVKGILMSYNLKEENIARISNAVKKLSSRNTSSNNANRANMISGRNPAKTPVSTVVEEAPAPANPILPNSNRVESPTEEQREQQARLSTNPLSESPRAGRFGLNNSLSKGGRRRKARRSTKRKSSRKATRSSKRKSNRKSRKH